MIVAPMTPTVKRDVPYYCALLLGAGQPGISPDRIALALSIAARIEPPMIALM